MVSKMTKFTADSLPVLSANAYVHLAGGLLGQAASQMRGQQGPTEEANAGTLLKSHAAVAGHSSVAVVLYSHFLSGSVKMHDSSKFTG